jgi:hypothetical protein
MAALALAATARADFTAATLVSGTSQLQFDDANVPALSADGRYAVFQGSLAGVPGLYRRDLRTGQVTQIAGGDSTAPSVSADGRYVAFTTTADLDPAAEPAADQGCPEVYVRDMNVESGSGEYTLAAALDGTGEGITYASCPPAGAGFAFAGAQAAPALALSADGRHVVFTVLGVSNLAGPNTEPSQVVVRDLDAKTTTLVTAAAGGSAATPGGGAFPSTDSEKQLPKRIPSPEYSDQPTASSAAISADASTVAWLGTNVPAQVPSSAAELEAGKGPHYLGRDPVASEVEPLWRRVADGPAAVTRRLLAAAGLDFFYVNPTESTDPAITGSLVGLGQAVFAPPALSADGRTAVVLASAPPPALESSFLTSGRARLSTDAYVVDVGADPASSPRVTALTEIPDYAASLAAVAYVKDLAVTPDGTRVAFDAVRTQFNLPALALISPPVSYTHTFETYEANLTLRTLQRVTSTYSGVEPNGGAGLMSFSGDGQTLSFASSATNLFFGDAVNASQVYVVHELPSDAQVAPQQIGAQPPPQSSPLAWLLSATAVAMPDGSVLVDAQVPGAGKLGVRAGAQLPRPVEHSLRRAAAHMRTGARIARGGRRSKGRSHKSGSTTIPARTVARGGMTASATSELRVRLRVGAAYRALVASRHGLYAVLRLTFAAPRRRTLVEEVPVTFRRIARGKNTHRTTHRQVVRTIGTAEFTR